MAVAGWGTVSAASSQQALGVASAQFHHVGRRGDGKLVVQNAVEHLSPGLFLLSLSQKSKLLTVIGAIGAYLEGVLCLLVCLLTYDLQ